MKLTLTIEMDVDRELNFRELLRVLEVQAGLALSWYEIIPELKGVEVGDFTAEYFRIPKDGIKYEGI